MKISEYPSGPILIVDDETFILKSLSAVLRSAGFSNIETCDDSRLVMDIIEARGPSLVLLDLTMPYISGEKLLPEIRAQYPELPVLIITGVNELSTAVECMKNGASDYLVKAIENNKLVASIRNILSITELREENRLLKNSMLSGTDEIHEAFKKIITEDRGMHSIFRYLSLICGSKQTILIRGETGTGKELVAEAIHEASERKGPFVSVNAAGLDDTMFSDALFGHRKGAYSGADDNRSGLIEKATDGTLFLDEIGDLTVSSQVKLLRLLEKGEYYQLGSDIQKKASCRIIAATNCDLEKLMNSKIFRKDLYYRLSAHEVTLPPLRQRRRDIPLLVRHFSESLASELNIDPPKISSGFIRMISNLDLQGNVRELITIINRCLSSSVEGVISEKLLMESVPDADAYSAREENTISSPEFTFPESLPQLKEWSNLLVDEALRRTGGNISAAAGLLGISQPALSKRLSRR